MPFAVNIDSIDHAAVASLATEKRFYGLDLLGACCFCQLIKNFIFETIAEVFPIVIDAHAVIKPEII